MGVVNHEMPALESLSNDQIDRLIIEQGLTLQGSAFDSLTVDEETSKTIQEVE